MSTHLITDYGAVPDGQTVNTQAIQKAIDAAASAGGGVVVIPAGTFVSGTIHLKSRVTLEVQPAGVLLGSGEIGDYPEDVKQRKGDRHRHHLIIADGCENVTIRGGGTIDGNGPAFWKEPKGPRQWIGAKQPRVSPMFEIRNCQDVRIENVTIRNSPGWTVHPFCCDRVWIRGIRLLNHLFGPNTDGLDINGCRDVFISDSHIECGDDAIVLKTTEDSRSCERVTVTNCVIRTNCVALKCGTESWHDFRQIAFSNCVVYKSTRAFGLYAKDGGVMEDIAVTGIVCDTDSGMILNRPIHIDAVDRTPESIKSTIRNVQISNFVARTDGRLLLTAADGHRVQNIVLRDISLRYPVIDDPSVGADSRSSQFSNHSPEARVAGAAIVADGIEDLVVDGVTVTWPTGEIPDDWYTDIRMANGTVGEFRAAPANPAEQPAFALLWGRNLRGGRIHCPLARPSSDEAEKYDLRESTITVAD